MSPQTKILVGAVAITAFVIGIAMNRPTSEDIIEVKSLLSAELLQTKPGKDDTIVAVNDHLGKLTMINFWATWCAPCREEMPLFETMYQLHQADGFEVIGIAIDTASTAQPFLDSMGISYPILYAKQTGMTLMEENGNPNQLLPYTLLLNDQGEVLAQKIGQVHEADIRNWLKAYLQ